MTQIWLAVDEDGEELLFSEKPVRSFHTDQVFWVPGSDWGKILPIPTGTIEKIIGHKLTWADDAVMVGDECWDELSNETYRLQEKRMSDELKPCPVCGNFPKVGEFELGENWMAECFVAAEHSVTVFGATREEAIAKWNTRAK